jgi:hypothetical protein
MRNAMRLPTSLLIVLSALLLGGCNTLRAAKLLAPGCAGLLDMIARLNAGQPWDAASVAGNIFSGNAESFLP